MPNGTNNLARSIAQLLLMPRALKTGEARQLLRATDPEEQRRAYYAILGRIAKEGIPEQEMQEGTPADLPAEMDPRSPSFDMAAHREAVETAGGVDAIAKQMQEVFSESAVMAESTLLQLVDSEAYKKVKEAVNALSSYLEWNKDRLAALAQYGEELQELAPMVQAILDEEGANVTAEEVIEEYFDHQENPEESAYYELIEQAKARLETYRDTAETVAAIEELKEEIPRITSAQADSLTFPLDKPNSEIWKLIKSADPNGQIKMRFDTSRKGSDQEALVLYSVNFDELKDMTITKQLTQYDKRCYMAGAALWNAGNEIVSATQIYYMMGNKTPPNPKDIKKVNDSLTKMGAAHIYIDNEMEVNATKGGYTHFKYDAPLWPFERTQAYINGQLTESAVHMFREPPLISFAKQRNQITTIPRKLLESPMSKTEGNLVIDDYLQERIGHMKSGKSNAPRKMLYSTIYENCNIKSTKQKQRAPEKIKIYLDHYKSEDGEKWIYGYAVEKDGIVIFLNKAEADAYAAKQTKK